MNQLPNRRAAIIIGVSSSAGLPKLESVQAGARSVASWLGKLDPGYDVTVISDEKKPVTLTKVKKAISKVLTPSRYEMLVIYYIGHGLYLHRSDVWLLSDLPSDMGACIDLRASRDDAKFCGVPNVVFVSDACRSLPDNIGLSRAQPTGAFPFLPQFTSSTTKVDYFCATAQGFPAYEGVIGGMKQSYLTHALKQAYAAPRPDMVARYVHSGRSINIVPNRRLEDFLQDTIDTTLGAADFTKTQRIEANVPSGDDVFIAPTSVAMRRVPRSSVQPQPEPYPPNPEPSAMSNRDIVRGALEGRETPAVLSATVRGSLRSYLPHPRIRSFETQTGVSLRGASIGRAVLSKRYSQDGSVERASEKEEVDLDVLRVNLGADRLATLVIELTDGRCILVPALHGYVAHLTVDASGLSGISYVRSQAGWHDDVGENETEQIDRLRAAATIAMNKNRFQVGSEKEAGRLASLIRMGKAVDPVLGLLAAYAYSEAGLDKKIKSVSRYMSNDIGADLFDVRLLSNRRWSEAAPPVVPPCPMLTQGWSLLRSRGASVPPVLESAPLTNALFTTFKPDRRDAIIAAGEAGEF